MLKEPPPIPIIVDKNNYIVNGHHRYDVARELEMERVKVIKVDATIEDLIDHYNHKASDEPASELYADAGGGGAHETPAVVSAAAAHDSLSLSAGHASPWYFAVVVVVRVRECVPPPPHVPTHALQSPHSETTQSTGVSAVCSASARRWPKKVGRRSAEGGGATSAPPSRSGSRAENPPPRTSASTSLFGSSARETAAAPTPTARATPAHRRSRTIACAGLDGFAFGDAFTSTRNGTGSGRGARPDSRDASSPPPSADAARTKSNRSVSKKCAAPSGNAPDSAPRAIWLATEADAASSAATIARVVASRTRRPTPGAYDRRLFAPRHPLLLLALRRRLRL